MYTRFMLASGIEVLAAGTTTSAASGASAQLIAANPSRNGLLISVDPAGTSPVYLLLGAGTASATVFHIPLGGVSTGFAPRAYWDGHFAPGDTALWRGAVQVFGTGTRVSCVEV